MKTPVRCFVGACALLLSFAAPELAEAKSPPRVVRSEVEFVNPQRFSDARLADTSYEASLGPSLTELRKFILEQAAGYLPDGTFLRMRITEVMDAGRFRTSRGGRQLRVTSDRDPGIIEFDYQWVAADGRVLRSGHQRLVNTLFPGRLSGTGGDMALGEMPAIKIAMRNFIRSLR